MVMVEPHLDCVAQGRLGDVRLLLSGEGVVALVLDDLEKSEVGEGAVVVVKDGLVCLGDAGP